MQIALARLQGVGPSPRLTPKVTESLQKSIKEAGLITDLYDHWHSGQDAFERAQSVLTDRELPPELTLETVSGTTCDQ